MKVKFEYSEIWKEGEFMGSLPIITEFEGSTKDFNKISSKLKPIKGCARFRGRA